MLVNVSARRRVYDFSRLVVYNEPFDKLFTLIQLAFVDETIEIARAKFVFFFKLLQVLFKRMDAANKFFE